MFFVRFWADVGVVVLVSVCLAWSLVLGCGGTCCEKDHGVLEKI